MDLGLAGKRALVMASSRGLGLGIAQALAAEGCHVLLSGRSEAKLAGPTGKAPAKQAAPRLTMDAISRATGKTTTGKSNTKYSRKNSNRKRETNTMGHFWLG